MENGVINQGFENYIDGWAEMMINIWKEKMKSLDIKDTGALMNSLRTEVVRQSGGNAAKVDLFYLFYGNYVDLGVGREMGINGRLGKDRNELGQFLEDPKRKPKPWLRGSFWYSKQKLRAKMLEQTGRAYLESVAAVLKR
jgi:hypothetical protein